MARVSLVPRSLFGQVVLAVTLALLFAQLVSAVLLYRASELRRDVGLVNAAAFQLSVGEVRGGRADGERGPRNRNRADRDRGSGLEARDGPRVSPDGEARLPRRFRFRIEDNSPQLPGEFSDADRAASINELLATRGIVPAQTLVMERDVSADPALARFLDRSDFVRTRFALTGGKASQRRLLVAAIRSPDSTQWQVARILVPERDIRLIGTLILQTLVIMAVLAIPLYVILRRLTRPLAQLTKRTLVFADGGARQPDHLAASGPSDIRQLIGAHNLMEERIAAMLQEKDVMLGAIGHDLKTPLAALRVRVESVENARQRNKMAATIADMTEMLDDILDLARIGKGGGEAEITDLSELAKKVVARHRELGQPVELGTAASAKVSIHGQWLTRALSNLIDNAVRYGGQAHVSVIAGPHDLTLAVEDQGPGIAPDQLEAMLEPFARGEESRNRATGGSGLGLAIARAVARQHGGQLSLENREGGGLRAAITLPRTA